MSDLTARITEILRALPSPIGAEPFTENDDGAPMWLSCLPWELLLCKVAKIAAAAAEQHYQRRIETPEQLDALPDASVVLAPAACHQRIAGRWREVHACDREQFDAPELPATLLWSPGAGQ